jgi:hypothetical protein
MSYGLNVKNSNDIILIDQDYSNYAVFSQGILPNGSAPLTSSNADELIYYTSDTNGDVVFYDPFSGVWSGSAIRYIRLRPLSAAAPGNEPWGLRVYDNQSRNVFDSSSRYIKPVGMYSFSPFGANQTYNLPAPTLGRKLWFSNQVFKLIECQDTGMGFGEGSATAIVRNSATSWTLRSETGLMGPPATFANSYAAYFFMVIEA